MMKRNRLYTVNRWNKKLLNSREDLSQGNLFTNGGLVGIGQAATKWVNSHKLGSDNKGTGSLNTVDTSKPINTSFNPKVKPIPDTTGGSNILNSDIAKVGLGAVTDVAGSAVKKGLSGGLDSGVGNGIAGVGSAVGKAVGMLNPVAGAAISLGSAAVGGAVNGLFGTGVNEAELAKANEAIDYYGNFNSNAGDFDSIKSPFGMASFEDPYKTGILRSKSGKNDELRRSLEEKMGFAYRSIDNNIYNLAGDQLNDSLFNYRALGGPLDTSNMGAIEYNFMSDYLTNKRRQAENKNLTSPQALFAFGGDMQSHGGDYPTGLTHIDVGGSHEMNPNDGVQMGVDSEGTPNLVEEGETIWNDYVFSQRILVDNTTKEKFHLPKKKDITYAEAAKKLEKEISERPNDPISQAGFNAQMQLLQEQQERQKQEMEAERAREAFESLSPEEQVAVMENAAQQEQAAMQQQVMAEQQMQGAPVEQGVPEELMQQQMMPQEEGAMPVEQVAPVMAYGGKVNKFDTGGPKYSYKDALAWARKKGFGVNDAQYIARALGKIIDKNPSKYSRQDVSMFGDNSSPYVDYEAAYNSMIPTLTSTREKWFNEWVKLGVPRNLAFGITHKMPVFGDTKGLRERELAYNKLVRDYKKPVSASRTASTGTFEYSPIPFGNAAFTPSNLEPAYSLERPAETTAAPTPTTTQTPPVRGASVAKVAVQPEAPSSTPVATTPETKKEVPVATPKAAREVPVVAPRVTRSGVTGDWIPYDWYRNGSDGYSTPTGFTVGANGLIDKENGYTQEYRDLVSKLTAKNIRDWASKHPNDPSLRSFLAKGNKLEDLTDDQWRRGALDGKYGFMHHVSDQILQETNDGTLTEAQLAAAQRSPQIFHAMDGDDYDDGYIEGALGPEVGPETRREVVNPETGDIVIYHSRKKPEEVATEAGGTKEEYDLKPIHRDENLRYAGLLGPAAGLFMQGMGIGKPDFSEMDRTLANAARNYHLATNKYLGNYMKYKPLDIWYEQAKLDAQSRATDRAIANSVSPSKTAGLLANSYNSQIASGNLFRQAQEYNDALKKQVAEYNRGTDQFNADAYNKLSQFNAGILNSAANARAELATKVAAQKMAANTAWNQGIYGNVAGLFKGIGDLGRENAQRNMVADLAASGAIPGVNPDNAIFSDLVKRVPKKKVTAKGGKIRKKKGLTY